LGLAELGDPQILAVIPFQPTAIEEQLVRSRVQCIGPLPSAMYSVLPVARSRTNTSGMLTKLPPVVT
jgi:hypothetical protein